MRVAVCTADMDARHELSRLVDDALLRRGLLPELTMFPMLPELMESVSGEKSAFDLIIAETVNGAALHGLCRSATVILVGGKGDGPDAFEWGAGYFVESPVSREALDRAIARCLKTNKEERAI